MTDESPSTAGLLGGTLRPTGMTVSFLDRPLGVVLDEVVAFKEGLGKTLAVSQHETLLAGSAALDPMEAPWTTELLVDCGSWTAYMNNCIDGGDSSASAPALSAMLDSRCVTATHAPMNSARHAATQLWLQGPTGRKPLRYLRTLDAHCADGRWSWYEAGEVQEFEEPERYNARLVRRRLDRILLISYLSRLGIQVDDPSFFGASVSVRETVGWDTRKVTVADWRNENA